MEEKRKVMISQPMNGLTDATIKANRDKAVKYLESQGFEVVDTLFDGYWTTGEAMKEAGVVNVPVNFLAKSIEKMSMCHTVYFLKGWENARGCCIEHSVAVAYHLQVIEE